MKKIFGEIKFEELTPEQFEHFCYDLIIELGYHSIKWKKGSINSITVGDQGRDIEAKKTTIYPDNTREDENWFFECKHYTKTVNQKDIINLTTWSEAERPAHSVFITSSMLSNSATTWVETYNKRNDKFKLHIWDRYKLNEILQGKSTLLRKYNLTEDKNFEFLKLLHPAHLTYLKMPSFNTLDYFFNLYENYDFHDDKDIVFLLYSGTIGFQTRKPLNKNEKMKDLILDEVTYLKLKEKIFEQKAAFQESFIVRSLVYTILHWLSFYSDTSDDTTIKNNEKTIKHLSLLKSRPEIQEMLGYDEAQIDQMIKYHKESLMTIPKTQIEYKDKYDKFCTQVLEKLYNEDLFSKLLPIANHKKEGFEMWNKLIKESEINSTN
jgi:hypothetical protein